MFHKVEQNCHQGKFEKMESLVDVYITCNMCPYIIANNSQTIFEI